MDCAVPAATLPDSRLSSSSIAFTDADGAAIAGEVVSRDLAGFTLRTEDEPPQEIAFHWDALGPETAFGLWNRLLSADDGRGWLNAAHLLETMAGGPPWADRALDLAIEADSGLVREKVLPMSNQYIRIMLFCAAIVYNGNIFQLSQRLQQEGPKRNRRFRGR